MWWITYYDLFQMPRGMFLPRIGKIGFTSDYCDEHKKGNVLSETEYMSIHDACNYCFTTH